MNIERASKSRVYLVGAGPGDPKLITVKGMECIQKADVIIYDRLINPRLLSSARPEAEMIYVGKSPRQHTLRQDEISQLLVDKARENKIVVRLKGGDPYVFGRGGEEGEFLYEEGIPFEVVPGITSSIAVPSYAGIPVTHRKFASSFAVITGNEDPTKESSRIDWNKIATGHGTLIFLMGMGNLPHIVHQLIDNGRSDKTPIALIRWGTWPEQETLVGTLKDIVAKSKAQSFTNPAVIIAGDVVNLRDKLNWFEKRPLFGKRVLITRARTQASVLAEKIEELGGEAWEFPTIAIQPPRDYGPVDQAIDNLSSYDWLIFTSTNGVRMFFKRLYQQGKDVRDLPGVKVCAVGPKTKEALENHGICSDYVPAKYRAEAILRRMQDQVTLGDRFLLPRSNIARSILPDTLRKAGMTVDDPTAYETVLGQGDKGAVQQMLGEEKIHIVTFTSSSTVQNLALMLQTEDLPRMLEHSVVACIGPVTARTAEDLGLTVDIQAENHTIDGLVRAIIEYVGVT